MLKLQRNYRIEVQDKFGEVRVIAFPLRCDFQVSRNTLAGYNTGDFTVYNLSDSLRSSLVRNTISFSDSRTFKFYAGYGSGPDAQLPLVFSGLVQTCVSDRDSVEWYTRFECNDPDPISKNRNISVALQAGSFQASNIENLINTFMNPVQFGKIGSLFENSPTLPRGNAYSGSITNILRSITNKNFFVDNGKAYVLAPWECLQDEGISILNADTGLLGSPHYEQSFVNCKLIFEPQIVMAQKITLQCDQAYLNGDFKVVAFNHNGTISAASAGTAITEVSLYNPLNSQGLTVLQ